MTIPANAEHQERATVVDIQFILGIVCGFLLITYLRWILKDRP